MLVASKLMLDALLVMEPLLPPSPPRLFLDENLKPMLSLLPLFPVPCRMMVVYHIVFLLSLQLSELQFVQTTIAHILTEIALLYTEPSSFKLCAKKRGRGSGST